MNAPKNPSTRTGSPRAGRSSRNRCARPVISTHVCHQMATRHVSATAATRPATRPPGRATDRHDDRRDRDDHDQPLPPRHQRAPRRRTRSVQAAEPRLVRADRCRGGEASLRDRPPIEQRAAVDEDVRVHDRDVPDERHDHRRAVDRDRRLAPWMLLAGLRQPADRGSVELDPDRAPDQRRQQVEVVIPPAGSDRPVEPLPGRRAGPVGLDGHRSGERSVTRVAPRRRTRAARVAGRTAGRRPRTSGSRRPR